MIQMKKSELGNEHFVFCFQYFFYFIFLFLKSSGISQAPDILPNINPFLWKADEMWGFNCVSWKHVHQLHLLPQNELKFHASSTKGFNWNLFHLIVIKSWMKQSALIFMLCSNPIYLGGELGILIFLTQNITEWSL